MKKGENSNDTDSCDEKKFSIFKHGKFRRVLPQVCHRYDSSVYNISINYISTE